MRAWSWTVALLSFGATTFGVCGGREARPGWSGSICRGLDDNRWEGLESKSWKFVGSNHVRGMEMAA